MADESGDYDVPVLALARARAKAGRSTKRGGPSKRTIQRETIIPGEAEHAAAHPYPDDVQRPRTRADCAVGPRPCPFVSCAHHLYLDVSGATGSITVTQPGLEPWELTESCALDVADRGGVALEEIAKLLGVTRERIRQIEAGGLASVALNRRALGKGV